MSASPKICCIVSGRLALGLQEGPSSASKMSVSVTSGQATSIQQSWRLRQPTVTVGDLPLRLQFRQKWREEKWEAKRQRRRLRADSAHTETNEGFTCSNCNRICRYKSGLYSHSRRCNSTTD